MLLQNFGRFSLIHVHCASVKMFCSVCSVVGSALSSVLVVTSLLLLIVSNYAFQVNGEVFDLDRVLEGDCTLEFLKFEDDEGK